MILYPLVAAVFVALAQYAYTKSQIAGAPDKEGELWLKYRNFLYLLSGVLLVATLVAVWRLGVPAALPLSL